MIPVSPTNRLNAQPRWNHAVLLALACTLTACSVALHPAAPPTQPVAASATIVPVPNPTPTTTPTPIATELASPSPTPIPRLAHLDAPADPVDDDAPIPAAEAAVERTLAVTGGSTTLERHGLFLVAPARIAGRMLGNVLLDTSAGETFVDERLADELSLPEIATDSAAAPPERRTASRRELRGLTIGELALSADWVFVADFRKGSALIDEPLAGVIGLATLGTTPFTLDFTTGRLVVYTDASFEPPANVPAEALRMDQGLPFVEATLADGKTIWLLLDSGSPAGISVWRGFARQHPGLLKPASPAAGAEPPTPNAARSSELRSLRLLGAEFDRIPVLVQDAPARPWRRAQVVGRVGMAVLGNLRLTVHPATERIWIERPGPSGDQ